MTTRPKVLLLGNGIARTYYKGANWDKVLDEIRDKKSYPMPSNYYKIPMPLKADMFAKNNLDQFLELLNIDLPHDKEHNFFPQLLNLDFDYILTTNYTYEAECALLNAPEIEISRINRAHYLIGNTYFNNTQEYSDNETEQHRAEIDRIQEFKNLISTYNDIENKKIWHIHGEAAYPSTMVLGYSAYAQLLHSYIDHIDHLEINNHGEETWLNKFLEGDVYILGFGMDFAEIDLWWLLQHKNNEATATYFFNPQPYYPDDSALQQYIHGTSEWCKLKMLGTCGVKIIDIKFNNILDDGSKSYKEFYDKALAKIQKYVPKRNSDNCESN